jgi:FdhD protein
VSARPTPVPLAPAPPEASGSNALPMPPRSLEYTQVLEWSSGRIHRVQDSLAAEEPLEIRVNGAGLTVTMRTPGHDEELAAGFLFTEGVIDRLDQLVSLRTGSVLRGRDRNVVHVELKSASGGSASLRRNFYTASSCGICGKSSIESIRRRGLAPPNPEFRIDPALLCTLPDIVRNRQAVFARTGGLHAAALFHASGELLALREDIGRHNAVDKIVGWALLQESIPVSDHVLLVSGRGGFEIVQKALAAGIPILACVSAPSSLAVRMAREMGITLIGFLRGERFVVYSGEFRCTSTSDCPVQADS